VVRMVSTSSLSPDRQGLSTNARRRASNSSALTAGVPDFTGWSLGTVPDCVELIALTDDEVSQVAALPSPTIWHQATRIPQPTLSSVTASSASQFAVAPLLPELMRPETKASPRGGSKREPCKSKSTTRSPRKPPGPSMPSSVDAFIVPRCIAEEISQLRQFDSWNGATDAARPHPAPVVEKVKRGPMVLPTVHLSQPSRLRYVPTSGSGESALTSSARRAPADSLAWYRTELAMLREQQE
jgi:hypothetical protein